MNSFSGSTLMEASGLYYRHSGYPHPTNPFTLYDYLGEGPIYDSYRVNTDSTHYTLSDDAYRRLMALFGPHAHTMVKARIAVLK